TIRDKLEDLLESLEKHSDNYFVNSKTYYYSIRESSPKSQIKNVVRLLFLNKTCFNGLYRVNRKGKFNVPLGRYTNPNIVNKDNLFAVNQVLRSENISITCRDFYSIINDVKKGDFIYFDPPYQPVSKTSNFTSYTNRDFSYQDLKRLAKLSEKLNSIGCMVMLSNSNSEKVQELFPSSRWDVEEIEANRAINSDSKKRTGHSELLIKNY